jgi:hypothetical protein
VTLTVRGTRTRHRGAHDVPMPSTLRIYTVEPGQEITIEIEQPDGVRAVVVGAVDSVPHSYWRGRVLKLRIADTRAAALAPKVTG